MVLNDSSAHNRQKLIIFRVCNQKSNSAALPELLFEKPSLPENRVEIVAD
jgi:hypothetical protein